MPPRKEPKEVVVYPASKRKVPAFKPLRPAKVPRTDSESSVKSQAAAKKPAAKKAAAKQTKSIAISDSEDEDDDDIEDLTKATAGGDSDGNGSEPPEDDRLGARTQQQRAPTKRKTSTREPSPMFVSPDDPPGTHEPPMPTQSDDVPSIPQPLLLRLLHEAFADKNTKIDEDAIQVFQKYVEIFVREAMARAQAEKGGAAERGEVTQMDAGWLDLEDLEKAAPGLFLDF